LALYGAGAAGVAVAGYLYLGSETKTQIKDEAKQLVKATNTESPLNAKEFTDFKLKRVEPYNWNTTKYVYFYRQSA
jgi:cytochrome-b5 reductase